MRLRLFKSPMPPKSPRLPLRQRLWCLEKCGRFVSSWRRRPIWYWPQPQPRQPLTRHLKHSPNSFGNKQRPKVLRLSVWSTQLSNIPIFPLEKAPPRLPASTLKVSTPMRSRRTPCRPTTPGQPPRRVRELGPIYIHWASRVHWATWSLPIQAPEI